MVLTDDRWDRIVDGHPELDGDRELVLAVAGDPSALASGRHPDETWLYGRGLPSRFLTEVVPMGLDDLPITIAGVRFDRVRYDAGADVL